MRRYTIRFYIPEGDLFPFAEQFDAYPELKRGPVHRMEVLEDGSVKVLGEWEGPPDLIREVVGNAEKTIDVTVTEGDTTFHHVHIEPCPVTRQMMETRRETPLAIQMPIRVRSDGSIFATYFGKDRAVSNLQSLLPDPVEMELVSTSTVERYETDIFANLTSRQRDILRVTVDLGYYNNPRNITNEDIAVELDISAAIVGEHLRKIEAQVFEAFRR